MDKKIALAALTVAQQTNDAIDAKKRSVDALVRPEMFTQQQANLVKGALDGMKGRGICPVCGIPSHRGGCCWFNKQQWYNAKGY